MKNCEQFPNHSVYDHGIRVFDFYQKLLHLLKNKTNDSDWKLPCLSEDNINLLLTNQESISIVEKYLINHDCGKPYCKTIDHDNKVHFTNHSNKSFEIYSKFFPDDKLVSELIYHDMDIHVAKTEDSYNISQLKFLPTLILSTYAELHANSMFFGGIESDSFKIKWKRINQRSKQILSFYKNN